MHPIVRRTGLLKEASELTRDGELGNSDAIRLLAMPHTAHEVREVLATFGHLATPQARGKLALELLAPLPAGVQNQRDEPIFDRYPVSGRTYTTAAGAVVANEVQYYNGQMVQVYGECSRVDRVHEALAGSGYQPLRLRYADGRESAVAHFWAHNLSDTSLRPYNAMFLIVAAVRDDAPNSQAILRADDNGVSSVLPVHDGTYDAARGAFTNRIPLYYHRLLDSTQVAIDVGRERMGTDKRPGTIQLSRTGSDLRVLVTDGGGHRVANLAVTLTTDPGAIEPLITRAAATAGVGLPTLPAGTEFVFPSVARIGAEPVVPWKWRTDLRPPLQRVAPGTIRFDDRSEVGACYVEWGFEARVLGFLPNVRGVVTDVPDTVLAPQAHPVTATNARPPLRPYRR